MLFMGLGKTLYNSSVSLIEERPGGDLDVEIALSERLLRKKASGAWPERALRVLEPRWKSQELLLAENRDVISPIDRETTMNEALPFFEYLHREKLDRFTRHYNSELEFVTHHLCHASAATAMSPFDKAVIVVLDGAGSAYENFSSGSAEIDGTLAHERLGGAKASDGAHEECTVYLMDRGRLRPVAKRWRKFEPSAEVPKKWFSESLGIFYESAAEYVFDSNRAAGKLMGLAPFGRAREVGSRIEFLESLDWSLAFKGKGKRDWDESGRFQLYADLAASVQSDFERELWSLLEFVRESFPDYRNCILTGGCALNCTFNAKLSKRGLFDAVYVPPFPGDESIGFGAASYRFLTTRDMFKPMPVQRQHGFFGPRSSVPEEDQIAKLFEGCEIQRPESITEEVAERLFRGEIVGWFQGRSESGPRSLGHRSILADPSRAGLKDELNSKIKFREDFRPYGCSCVHERAADYFDVDKGFDNPYMSFAVETRADWREKLSQVTHVDGTSRMQTVRKSQNPMFHELISKFGAKSGFACVLNTSLNVMGEPIVETPADARAFLEKTPVHGLAIGPFFITRAK
ncbi:MAG: carbamoyltransferase C-terminal domain-containing protein [Bdellovibrionota bacterium]